MSLEFDTPQGCKSVFWLSQGSLRKRLGLLVKHSTLDDVSITSTDLAGNASFVNFVRHHRLTDNRTGATLDVVEKSIRKIVFISSLEARFYRERGVLTSSVYFKHPTCYAVIETPWESLIFSQYVKGRAPRMHAIAADIARGIAEIETLSHQHLQTRSRKEALKFWGMDFFRPWYLLRPRFNFQRFLPHLAKLSKEDLDFQGLEKPLQSLVPSLNAMAQAAKNSARCFCHMDYLRKNLFVSPQGLQLIDWSEVKVGRVGFDGGAYLSALFRRSELDRFIQIREEFLQAYLEALHPVFDRQVALHNLHYLFLLNSLWHCLRPETILEYRQNGDMALLKKKYVYLLTLNDTNL